MKLLTVKEYAKLRRKSIPLIYKELRDEKIEKDTRYGRILIKVSKKEEIELTIKQ
jgi:hypothetical protein